MIESKTLHQCTDLNGFSFKKRMDSLNNPLLESSGLE